MRITLRTPTAIVVEDRAIGLRVLGVCLLVFAAILVYAAWEQSAAVMLMPAIIAVVLGAGGVASIVLPATLIYAFDKEQRQVVITRRRLTGTFRRTLPLRDVADVELERSGSLSSSGKSTPTWRVVLVLADGRREPWRVWYDSGYWAKAEVVATIRAFLGSAPADAAKAAAALAGPVSPQMPAAGLGCMAVFVSLFLAVGVGMVVVEHRKLSTYRPVDAEVLSTGVEYRSDSDGGGTWLPVVRYKYAVDDRWFEARRVTPLNVSAGRRNAERLIARFPVGTTVTAYYDPSSPGDAYLVHARSVFPYLFMALPGIALTLILYRMATTRRRARAGRATAARAA